MKPVYQILAAFFAAPPEKKITHRTIGTDEDADFHDVRRTLHSTLLCPHDIPAELPCRACLVLQNSRKPL